MTRRTFFQSAVAAIGAACVPIAVLFRAPLEVPKPKPTLTAGTYSLCHWRVWNGDGKLIAEGPDGTLMWGDQRTIDVVGFKL